MIGQSSAVPSAINFASLLRQLRAEARLTQEELAWKSGLSPRSISDLERGISRTARPSTANLLADALALDGPVRAAFVAVARGRVPVSDVMAARDHTPGDAPAAPILWYAGDYESLSLHEVKFVRKIVEAIRAAGASEGSAIAVVWLVGLTARGE